MPLQCQRKKTHVICVVNTRQKQTHLHSNCNINDAERENFSFGQKRRFQMENKTESTMAAFGHISHSPPTSAIHY